VTKAVLTIDAGERSRSDSERMKYIDGHVHIMGTGAGGTHCELHIGARKLVMPIMLKHIGMPTDALQRDFDRLYVERLLELVRGSSLHAAVILAMDHVYDERGSRLPAGELFYVPNEYVLELARRHPEFIPAVSIHPARPDALRELEKCLEGGAAMLKLLPLYQIVDCNDRRFTRFWERMAEAGLPLLSHTGGEHTVPNNAKHLGDPRTMELPLQCGVTMIAAHCATRSGLWDPDYLDVLVEMIGRYERLYADNSAFNIPLRSRAYRPALRPPLVDRLVHGSDYPVFNYARWARMRGVIDQASFDRWKDEPNILERDYQVKRAIGFPDAVFTRLESLLRKS
jgi:predicted TIM-barrel fold metal-dependent hydrolase